MINGFLNAPASLSDLDTSLNLLKDFLALYQENYHSLYKNLID